MEPGLMATARSIGGGVIHTSAVGGFRSDVSA